MQVSRGSACIVQVSRVPACITQVSRLPCPGLHHASVLCPLAVVVVAVVVVFAVVGGLLLEGLVWRLVGACCSALAHVWLGCRWLGYVGLSWL